MARKVKLFSKTYKKRAIDVADYFAPRMVTCGKCGSPVPDGYCCYYCGHDGSDDLRDEPMGLADIVEQSAK